MKTAIVLNGCSTLFKEQIEELNSFANRFLQGDFQIEAWILTHNEINKKDIRFIKQVNDIRFIKTKTTYLPEDFLDVIQPLFTIHKPELIVFGSGFWGAALSVRLGYRLNGSSCVDVKNCQMNEGKYFVEKSVYANNLTAKFLMRRPPYCISIAKGFRDEVDTVEDLPEFEVIQEDINKSYPWVRSYNIHLKEASRGLKTARIAVVIGKGVENKGNIKGLEQLACLMHGELGASRPVVMSAWTEMDKLIGASGSMIAPDVCIAIGISGAAAFTVGIENSKWIAAINKDEKAPIFKMSDVAIVGDYKEIIDELIKLFLEK